MDGDSICTNDAMNLSPDGQQFKYKREPKIVIGTEPRRWAMILNLYRLYRSLFERLDLSRA